MKEKPHITGQDFVDALNRGAAEAYEDPVQRAVLDKAIKAGSYVAPPRSTRQIDGPSIRDGFAPNAESEVKKSS